MTTRASKWVDDLVVQWINKIEDEAQLGGWQRMIRARIALLKQARTLSAEQIETGLRACKPGDKLYSDGTIFSRTEHYFVAYQPRKKRVWLASRPLGPRERTHESVALEAAVQWQLARTDLATRMRAPKAGA